ncbi:MAG: hypothetical protein H7Z21_02095 [Hymenobacter sp.]|nr:hypothetical protein [Hymenobacter sp.]
MLPMLFLLRHSLLTLFLVFLGLLLADCPPALARSPLRYAVAGNEKPVALLAAGKETYLVTERSVFQLMGRQFVRKYQSPAPIQCAFRADTVLWLGTRQGVLRLNTGQFRARPVALPVPEAPNVTALFQDATRTVWAGAMGHGAFRLVRGSFQPELSVPVINGGVATADSSVWIATNIGLHRLRRQQWIRYNEEGVANYEIPDNIVEKLLLDNTGNLWVMMSAGISVFEGDAEHTAASGESHLPTVTFIGKPGNEVYSAVYVSGEGRLFATAMGLLLLPEKPARAFAGFEPAATDKVEQQQLLIPLPALAAARPPHLIQFDQKQRAWLVSEDEVTVLTPKELRRFLHPQPAPKTGPQPARG